MRSKNRIGDFRTPLSRREMLTLASAGVIGYSATPVTIIDTWKQNGKPQ